MKKSSIIVLLGSIGVGVAALGWHATPSFAETLTALANGSVITNNSAQNALSIVQNTDVGKGRSDSGALHLDNTGNANTGLTLYTNMGADAAQPLMRMEVDNTSWSEEVLYIHSDSPTSRGLIRLDSPAPEIEFVETDQDGAAGKFEVRVQHDILQFNSRREDDTTFEKKIGMTHEGDLEFYNGGISVESGEVSEFHGGINVTGGCIAVDGECVSLSSGENTPKNVESSAESPSEDLPASVTLSDGEPRDIECNSFTERGRLALDYTESRLYVCNGPERGWDYLSLSN